VDFKLYNDDCLNVFPLIPDRSVDAIICDLPYGTTACSWDSIIPFDSMWLQYERIIKDNGAIVLFGSQPFTSALIMSNVNRYKYQWIWEKNKVNGLIKNQPRRGFEDIVVFYKKPCTWNEIPIKRTESEYNLCKRTTDSKTLGTVHRPNQKFILKRKPLGEQWYKQPINILQFDKDDIRDGNQHPTQKPVKLIEYLILTYTNENETVLDNCMGSGTTGVACKLTNRKFIGIEKEPEYFNIAQKRISETQAGGLFFNSNTYTEL